MRTLALGFQATIALIAVESADTRLLPGTTAHRHKLEVSCPKQPRRQLLLHLQAGLQTTPKGLLSKVYFQISCRFTDKSSYDIFYLLLILRYVKIQNLNLDAENELANVSSRPDCLLDIRRQLGPALTNISNYN